MANMKAMTAPTNSTNSTGDSVAPDLPEDAAVAGGFAVIQAQVKTLPNLPGVYRMLGREGEVLYVGKAKDLKKRVTSYTKPRGQTTRILRMIQLTEAMEVVTTHTEVEALLLEANLIKKLKPRYNISYRDDKSFPYILLTTDHDWPQLAKHRGARNRPGEYFGPFASAKAVNRTLHALQRAFPLRSCSDADFASRSRPCLQYQIKRCTAPCVGRTSGDDYADLVGQVRDFLAGRSHDIQNRLSDRMQVASDALDFETAAAYRDRIKALAHIQARQGINLLDLGEADVIAAHQEAGQTCIQVFFFRSGQNCGNRAYYPSHARDVPVADVMAAFITQFYDARLAPAQLLLSDMPTGHDLIAEALSLRAERKVRLTRPQRGAKKDLVGHAIDNAKEALARKLAESSTRAKLLRSVGELFALEAPPERIEVYDNSHIQGSNAIGAMIVHGPDGFVKNAYRKFNIKDTETAPGDDYAMMREVLTRRFARLSRERARADDTTAWPDLVLIDGGKGQLGIATSVLTEMALDDVRIAAIAKGPDRNAGRENIFLPGRDPFSLPPQDPILYFLQRLRDEAHRFAIGSHRQKRAKSVGRSGLDDIPGIGPRRKKLLLNHFGSARDVASAGLADLEAVAGISHTVARTIYDYFHGEG